jgi:hypothetical protein
VRMQRRLLAGSSFDRLRLTGGGWDNIGFGAPARAACKPGFDLGGIPGHPIGRKLDGLRKPAGDHPGGICSIGENPDLLEIGIT